MARSDQMETLCDDILMEVVQYIDFVELLQWRATCKRLRANNVLRKETVARVDWWDVSIGNLPRRVTLHFAAEFAGYINWTLFCLNHSIPESFAKTHKKIIDPDVMAACYGIRV